MSVAHLCSCPSYVARVSFLSAKSMLLTNASMNCINFAFIIIIYNLLIPTMYSLMLRSTARENRAGGESTYDL